MGAKEPPFTNAIRGEEGLCMVCKTLTPWIEPFLMVYLCSGECERIYVLCLKGAMG